MCACVHVCACVRVCVWLYMRSFEQQRVGVIERGMWKHSLNWEKQQCKTYWLVVCRQTHTVTLRELGCTEIYKLLTKAQLQLCLKKTKQNKEKASEHGVGRRSGPTRHVITVSGRPWCHGCHGNEPQTPARGRISWGKEDAAGMEKQKEKKKRRRRRRKTRTKNAMKERQKGGSVTKKRETKMEDVRLWFISA